MSSGIGTQDRLVLARVPAWHQMGKVVPKEFSSVEAQEWAGLNYTLQKKPVYVRIGDKAEKIAGQFALVCSDTRTALPGVTVGNLYNVLQPADAFKFFDGVVASGEAFYDTVGTLWNRRKLFMTARISNLTSIEVAGDQLDAYLLLSNSYDGTEKVTVAVAFIRVVCANTERLAVRGAKSTWKVRHTPSMDGKLENLELARNTLGLSVNYMRAFEQVANQMASKDVSDQTFREVLEGINFPVRAIEPVLALRGSVDNLSNIRGSAWGAYNAVTQWADWERRPRTMDAWANGVMYWSELKEQVADALIAA